MTSHVSAQTAGGENKHHDEVCAQAVSEVIQDKFHDSDTDINPEEDVTLKGGGVNVTTTEAAYADEDKNKCRPSSPASEATTRVNSGMESDNPGNNTLHPHIGSTPEYTWSAKLKPLKSLLILLGFSSIFCALYCAFIFVVLIRRLVETPGGIFWDASKTNYVVGVLSQFSALLTDATIRALFGVLQPALTAQEGGTSFATWIGLGSSDWSSVFQVAAVNRFVNVWCDFRLSLPLLSLAFGSVLKFQADFEYYFIPGPPRATMPVYAGLTPPDITLLSRINASDLSMYFVTWGSSLLGSSQFAQDFSLEGCDGDCRSVILAGGIQLPRQVKPLLNESIYSGPTFDESDTITVINATGMVVKYEGVPDSDDMLAFNITTDCVYSSGQDDSNGLQICVKQDNDSMIVGWSACPIALYDRGTCNHEPDRTAWRAEPITAGTRMSLYKQVTTTAYNRDNQSIVNIAGIGSPTKIPLSAANYTRIFERALVANVNSSAVDRSNINMLVYTVTWMHRTFLKSFPGDNNSSVSNLHNFLAVPIQFSVTANEYANYTVTERGWEKVVQFPMPDEMITVARGGSSSSRLAILPWAGWVFITADAALHLALWVGVAWILWPGRRAVSGQMGVMELHAVRSAVRSRFVLIGPNPWERRALKNGWFGGTMRRLGRWLFVLGSLPLKVRRSWWGRWVKGARMDEERFFATGDGGDYGYDIEKKKVGASVIHVALDPKVEDDVPPWRMARAGENVRVVQVAE